MDPVLQQIYQLVVPSAPYVIAAYGVLWLGLFGFMFMLNRRLNKLEDQIAVVEEAAARKSPGASAPTA